MKQQKYAYEVLISPQIDGSSGGVFRVRAKTDGRAAHLAFRQAIGQGKLKRQPPINNSGGWRGVHFRRRACG